MKKVLLLVGIVFGAVLAQAIDCKWNVTFVTTEAQAWEKNGAVVMMFAGSDFADVKKLIATNTGNTLGSALIGKTLKVSEGASFMTFTADTDGLAKTYKPQTSTLPSDGQAFWMIFTDEKLTAETTVYWTGVLEASESMSLTEDNFTTKTTIGEIAKEYATVPEAGVMALLALGVAGLALRRKVA